MSEEDIDILKSAISDGIIWVGNGKRITSIVARSDEPSRVAYFDDGTYVALYNTGTDEFYAPFFNHK